MPEDISQYSELIPKIVGDHEVIDCQYSAATKKLVLSMNPTAFGLAELRALAPVADELLASHTTDRVRGVMVTTSGRACSLPR